jgi:hypothetical protein
MFISSEQLPLSGRTLIHRSTIDFAKGTESSVSYRVGPALNSAILPCAEVTPSRLETNRDIPR